MKRKRTVKWINAGLLLCLCLSVAAGCKNKAVDYDMEGVSESSESSRKVNGNSEEGLKQFADAIEDEPYWQEKLTEVELADGSTGLWGVEHAEISIPDAEQMYVVEVEERYFDEAEKERIAGQLFGEEVYYYDTAHLPRKDLEERQSRYQEEYDAASKTSEEGEQLEKKLAECEEAMKTAGDAYIPVDEYDVDEYLGKRGGIFYELSFEDDKTIRFSHGRVSNVKETYGRGRSISLVPKDIYQICSEEVSGAENLNYGVWDPEADYENKCRLSEEEALELAQSFVGDLDLDYSVYAGSSPLHWFEGTSFMHLADGYVFYFDAGIENLSFVQYGTQDNYYLDADKGEKTEELHYSLNARMEIYVNEKGIIGMKAENPIKVMHVSEGVKLLSLKNIEEIIKDHIVRGDGIPSFDQTELKLIYFRVRDKENQGYYSYIPTWRFARGAFMDEKMNAEVIDNVTLINAIDGSVIDFFDEV